MAFYITMGKYAGCRKQISKTTKRTYADVYIYPYTEDGTPDFEQVKIRTFSDNVIAACDNLQSGESVVLSLSGKDIILQEIRHYEDN